MLQNEYNTMIRKFVFVFVMLFASYFTYSQELNIIPQPNSVVLGKGEFDLSKSNRLVFKGLNGKQKKLFTAYLQDAGFSFVKKSNATNRISLAIDKSFSINSSAESYRLKVTANGIEIKAPSETGLFYAVQSLLQLKQTNYKIPSVEIEDAPRFGYRGVHIDVSRHFFSLDFLKKQIDMMAQLKINHFHWHITDGPGWRLEIKKYPLLTQVAAWRTHELWKDWWATKPRSYVDMHSGEEMYGGFFTQKEAKELVKYAAERHITVIPEIEMPGHSEEVLAVYPELSCVGEPYKQSEFCIGNEATFSFLENVLKEVMRIFPSEYIHVGGDEAEKHHWKECPKCQQRMKEEGLKNEEELQSYLIRRIERFLNKHNRKLLGWDEILQGGLAPAATVMSWRGEEGGIAAAKSGHDAIMTPGGFMYFDSYQANPATQPEAIGGYLPLEKVYSYDPIPTELTADEAKHILGVQSNLWAEYIPTEAHAEYMLYPRVLALAEVAWTEKEQKEWSDFNRRANQTIPLLRELGYNSFTLSDEVLFEHNADSVNQAIAVSLKTEKYGVDIRYTTDGTQPTANSKKYVSEILVRDSAIINAQLFDKDKPIGKSIKNRFDYHLGIGKKITYNIPINKYYPASGPNSLINGEVGGISNSDGRWQGFMTNGMDVTIDLGEVMPIRFITARFMQSIAPWIFYPKNVKISVSNDNENFTLLKDIPRPVDEKAPGTLFHHFGWSGEANARYIRYQGLPNEIRGGWVFVDEIVVW